MKDIIAILENKAKATPPEIAALTEDGALMEEPK